MADKIDVQGTEITVISNNEEDYISITDMVRDIVVKQRGRFSLFN